jgi:magnesium transporter
MIAGIYGMNFAYIPELQWKYGYFLALASMVIASLALFVGFRRSRWL